MHTYDCVVVGAGNSGLVAACRLALAGRRTLLIEQHNLPGGVATSFRRGRFEFDVSLHELCDLGSEARPGTIRRLFDKLGVKVDWIEIPDCLRLVSTWSDDGSPMDVTLPSGKEAFIEAVARYVPGARQGMEDFFALCEQTMEGIEYVTAAKGRPDPQVLMEKYPDFIRAGAQPAMRVLEALELPPRARDIISAYWSYLGVDLERLDWTYYIAMLYKYIVDKPYMPRLTAHEISSALEARFRELGGEVWYNCRAEAFLFDGGRCCGVRTTRGDVACRQVLANINPHVVYGRMVPPELVPERERKLAGARSFSGRAYVAFFGLSKTAEELGFHDYNTILCGTADSAREYADSKTLESNRFSIVLCHSVVNPDSAPEGGCVVSVTSMYGADCWGEVEPEDYHAMKNKVAGRMLDDIRDRMGIDLRPHIEEVCVASPWTFARYVGTPEGCVYGYEIADWDAMMARMMMIGRDYPIPGLRTIGAAGPQGDGYSSAYIVGNMFAGLALGDLRREEGGGENGAV